MLCKGFRNNNVTHFVAPTAAAQKADEGPMTYLNKGQYYTVVLKDMDRWEGEITSSLVLTFHEEIHRADTSNFWKFWLSHQPEAESARAIELDPTKSNTTQMIDSGLFDRVSFRWYGHVGATVHVRLNCLSTDFSRIKGVKGIPLRLQIESGAEEGREKMYCRIKLFRDKGAERKNKDDTKHIERQLEKLRGKHGEPHPFWLAYSPITPVTLFREWAEAEALPSLCLSTTTSPIGPDPPHRRRRVAKLSLLVRFESHDVYRAIYLQQLTVQELTEKILERTHYTQPVKQVFRRFKQPEREEILVQMEDAIVQQMKDEQDLLVHTQENKDDFSLTLILTF
ncbi:CP2 transcription factor-domain-containing protein [Sporodiniella umbellata]|nr:CP2 transcription factor-domain-containing protein [Sporodiniella umbellata]